jgi:hypothetical protein
VRRGAPGGRLAVVAVGGMPIVWGWAAGRVGLCRVVVGAEGRCDPAPRVSRGVHDPAAGVVCDTERREPGEVHCGRQQ